MIRRNRQPLLIAALVFILFWPLWTPGVKVAADFHLWSKSELEYLLRLPQLWRNILGAEGFGQNVIATAWLSPVVFLYSLFSHLGLPFSVLTRLLGIIPIVLLGAYGTNRLLLRYSLDKWSRVIGALFFLVNTYFILLIDGGQLFVAGAYCLLPLTFALLLESLDRKDVWSIFKFSLSAVALSVFDLRVLALLVLLILLYVLHLVLLRRVTRPLFYRLISIGILTGFSLLLFHAYWIVPALLSRGELSVQLSGLVNSDLQSFSKLENSLLLLQPHWYMNSFGNLTTLRPLFFALPLLVFMPLAFLRNKEATLFWGLVAIASIFLGKGMAPPLGSVYTSLLNYVPGFGALRDPTKFYMLIALSYAVLLALAGDMLMRFVRKKETANGRMSFLVPMVIILYLIILIRPVWLGKMTGLFSTPRFQGDYQSVEKHLNANTTFGRVLWLPNSTPLAHSSPTHPQALGYLVSEMRPFATGRVGMYERYNFLRDSEYIDQILDVSGLSYIAYPYPDPKKVKLKEEQELYYQVFLDQLLSANWSDGLVNSGSVSLIITKSHQDHIFVSGDTLMIIGADNVYQHFSKSNPLANHTLVFLEDGSASGIDRNMISGKYVLNNKFPIDAAANFISTTNQSLATDLAHDPDKDGWWKRDSGDFVPWREFLENKYGIDNTDFDYGNGWAVAEGNLKKSIENEKEGVLLLRAMESSRGGEITVLQSNEIIGRIDTLVEEPEIVTRKLADHETGMNIESQYDAANARWFKVGNVAAEDITLETEGDLNVINSYKIVPTDEWVQAIGGVEKMLDEGEIVYWDDVDLTTPLTSPNLSYETLSPTKYRVTLEGVNAPATIVFSEKYSPHWQMEGAPSFPVYTFLNGFQITEDGTYEIEFSLQTYVAPLLVIGWSVLLVAAVILYVKRKDKEKGGLTSRKIS